MNRFAFSFICLLNFMFVSNAECIITGENETSISRDEIYNTSLSSVSSNDTIPATFPGGRETLLKYISSHVVFPKSAVELNMWGICIAKATIDLDGKFINPYIYKHTFKESPISREEFISAGGLAFMYDFYLQELEKYNNAGRLCDEEVLRVVESLPRAIPAKVNRQPITTEIQIPVRFQVSD